LSALTKLVFPTPASPSTTVPLLTPEPTVVASRSNSAARPTKKVLAG
jgi:hypothetical protein